VTVTRPAHAAAVLAVSLAGSACLLFTDLSGLEGGPDDSGTGDRDPMLEAALLDGGGGGDGALGTMTVLASGLGSPTALALDGQSVHCAVASGVIAIAKSTGAVRQLAALPDTFHLEDDGANVFALANTPNCEGNTGSFSLMTRVSKLADGGSPPIVGRCGGPFLRMRGDPVALYRTSSSGVMRTARADGTETTEFIAPFSEAPLGAVLPVGGFVFVVSTANRILRITRGGAGNAFEVFADAQPGPQDLASDGAFVYWVNDGGTVMKRAVDAALEAGAPTPLATAQSTPWRIALDAKHAYWTNLGTKNVVRVPKEGGPVELVASGVDDPRAIAVDDSGVFIADRSGGKVLVVPKR